MFNCSLLQILFFVLIFFIFIIVVVFFFLTTSYGVWQSYQILQLVMGVRVTDHKAYSPAYCHLVDRLPLNRNARWVFCPFYDLVFVGSCCSYYCWYMLQLLHIYIKQIIYIFIATTNAINDLSPLYKSFRAQLTWIENFLAQVSFFVTYLLVGMLCKKFLISWKLVFLINNNFQCISRSSIDI